MQKVAYKDLILMMNYWKDNPDDISINVINILDSINQSKMPTYYGGYKKLRGFVNNHIIEETIKNKYNLYPLDEEWEYLTDRRVVGNIPDFTNTAVEGGKTYEVKRYQYLEQVETAEQDIHDWKNAYNKWDFNQRLLDECGRFVATHNADVMIYAVLKDNKIVFFDTKTETHIIEDFDWSKVKLF